MEDTTLRDEVRAAEADIAAGNPDQALSRCQKLQALYPRALVIQRVLGEVYLALRKPREALGALERALAGDPDDARACCARAIVHQIHGDSTAALAWYRRACEIRPDDATLRSAYRELATQLNQPSYRPTSVGLARLYLRGDLFAYARHEWEAILAQQPDRLDAQVGLAETFWRSGDAQRAGEIARRIVANIPSCLKALLIVAALEHAAGGDEEAGRLLQRAAELDPERRVGRALYADLVAAGDTGLEALLLGQPMAQSDGRAASRVTDGPRLAELTELPTLQVPAAGSSGRQPLVRPSLGPSQPIPATLPQGAQSDLREVGAFAQSRTTNIPPDFHQIFAETEFMLWGREDEDAGQPGVGQAAPSADPLEAFERSRVDRFERSSVIVPPALATSEGTMEDTEARTALGWVRWLQAQGARPVDAALRPSAAAPAPNGASEPQRGPSSISLREMFAELRPSSTGKSPVVEAGAMPSMGDEEWAQGGVSSTIVDTLPGVEASRSDSGAIMRVPTESAHTDQYASLASDTATSRAQVDGMDGALASATIAGNSDGYSHTSDGRSASSATTLETLERTLAAPGFQTFDPQPGSLAALAASAVTTSVPGDALAASDGHDRRQTFPPPVSPSSAGLWVDDAGHVAHQSPGTSGDGSGTREDVRAGTATSAAAASTAERPEDAVPDAEDYPARLQLARRLRRGARLEEAFVEYRAILKGSPDLLYELVGDLRDLAANTEQPEVHRLLGDAYIREGDYLNALESYNRALALGQGQAG